MKTTPSLLTRSAWLLFAAMAGCASPPPNEPSPPPPPPAPRAAAPAVAPAPAQIAPAAPVSAPAQPAAPSSVDTLETILKRVSDDSGIKISRTSTGALLVLATGDTSFNTGSATLSPRFNQFLQQLANALSTYGDLTAKVTGHTDSSGDAQLNDRLSSARAQATINRLVGLGISANRLLGEGKGQREPIASNDTAEGRAANRRVELLIIEP